MRTKMFKSFLDKQVRNVEIEDKKAKEMYGRSEILGFVFMVLMGLMWNKLPNNIPLLYSKVWGEERLVSKGGFVGIVGGLIVFVVGVNLLVGKFLEKKDYVFFVRIVGIASFMLLVLVGLVILNVVVAIW